MISAAAYGREFFSARSWHAKTKKLSFQKDEINFETKDNHECRTGVKKNQNAVMSEIQQVDVLPTEKRKGRPPTGKAPKKKRRRVKDKVDQNNVTVCSCFQFPRIILT